MEPIYYFAIVFAVLMAFFGIYYICWRENLIYLKAQLRMLSVGQVRRNLLSSQDKDGCIIYVVKAIERNKIISDTYIKKKGEYVLDRSDVELTVKQFYSLTDPEPVFKEERLTPVLKKYIKAESVCGTATKKSSKKSAQTK